MMQNMTRYHVYNDFMRDITIYDGKNMDLADWLLQIKKVSVLTNSQKYESTTAKSTSTPYKVLKIRNDLSRQEIKKKLEKVYSLRQQRYMPLVIYRRNNDLTKLCKSIFKTLLI